MDEYFMKLALKEAKKAEKKEEVPIGCVIVKDGEVISRGYNKTRTLGDPTAHAEMVAIRSAAKKLGGYKLEDCQMYVTLEPCSMCAGAIVHARIKKLFIGAMDKKAGACGSLSNIVQDSRLNHFVEIESGLLEEECSKILKDFFAQLRNKKSEIKSEES